MKLKRLFALLMAVVLMFSTAAVSFAQTKKIKSLKIIKEPVKLTYYKEKDWNYGIWEASDGATQDEVVWKWKSGPKISFLRNPGSGSYPERGMIDMSGLEIELTYTDGSKATVKYAETKDKNGIVTANILAAPRIDFTIGYNVLEVYTKENINAFDTFQINITPAQAPLRAMGDINYDGNVNSSDALLALRHAVGDYRISAVDFLYADVNKDLKINSADALMILEKAVGKI